MATNKEQNNKSNQRRRMKAVILSVVISIFLLSIKMLTYRITGSSAVLSDALESIINVVASTFALASVWMASKPPDTDHPYGHGKIEYFSAGFEGALIIAAAVGIFYSGIRYLLHPRPLDNLGEGLLILVVASTINLLLGLYLIRTGRRTDSVTLIADGKHVLTDVFTSAGVLVGLALVYLTGWLWIDGAVACLVGINILVTGGKLIRHAGARLMDASDPELLGRIADIIARRHRPDWVDIHQLRAWRAGSFIHIDLHLVLPQYLSLEKAHQESKIIEEQIIEDLNGNAEVLVHIDPCDPFKCPVCARHECNLRSSDHSVDADWNRQRITRATSQILVDNG